MFNTVKYILKGGTVGFRLGMFLLFIAGSNLIAGSKPLAELSAFRFVRSAVLPENTECSEENLYAINLDESFFQSTENPANDLRILNSAGNTVPFVLKRVSTETVPVRDNQLSGKIVRNQQLPDGRNAVDFELDENNKSISLVELVGDKIPAGIQLTIAVGDGRSWQIAVDKLQLTNISKLPEPVNRRFPLPRKFGGKIIRLIVEKGSFPALEAVRVYEQQQLEPVQGALVRQYAISAIGSKSEKNSLKISYNTNYVPLTRIKLQLKNPLYLNKVTLSGSNDRRKWQQITSGSIRRIDLDKMDYLDFPESRYKFIMLNIEYPQENPVQSVNIQAYGPAYHWLINGSSDSRKLSVYYNPSAPLPALSTHPAINSEPASTYTLSPQQPNKLRKTGVRDRNSWIHLAGALIVMLAMVATLVITSSVKHSGKLLPED